MRWCFRLPVCSLVHIAEKKNPEPCRKGLCSCGHDSATQGISEVHIELKRIVPLGPCNDLLAYSSLDFMFLVSDWHSEDEPNSLSFTGCRSSKTEGRMTEDLRPDTQESAGILWNFNPECVDRKWLSNLAALQSNNWHQQYGLTNHWLTHGTKTSRLLSLLLLSITAGHLWPECEASSRLQMPSSFSKSVNHQSSDYHQYPGTLRTLKLGQFNLATLFGPLTARPDHEYPI